MRIQNLITLGVLIGGATIVGCSSNDSGGTPSGGVGGSSGNTGGKSGTGTSVGGTSAGGTSGNSTTGAKTGGNTGNPAGGAATGGTTSSAAPTGGTSTGLPTGGKANTGGVTSSGPTGGTLTSTTGGVTSGPTGGKSNVGGTTAGVGGTTAGVGGTTTAVGGAATGGTTTVGGGGGVTPATPNCPTGNSADGVPNAANPPTSAVISDFETSGDTTNYKCVVDPAHPANPCSDQHLLVYKNGARGGTLWYGYTDYTTDPDSATTTSRSLPTLTWESTGTGTCTPGGVMHVKGPGNTGWGSGIGVDLAPRNATNQKTTYDASAYTGIGFNMKCASDVGYVYFKLIDANNDGDCAAASCGISTVCTYSGTTNVCNQYGYKNAWLTKNWSNYELYFDDALQDPNQPLSTTALNKAKLTALQMQFNTGYDTSGGSKVATSFDCYIDDVHFLTSTPPAPKTTCASGAYTTSGKDIVCGTTKKIFRGVARPSMEWDTSGWNVMPWDMARIKNQWKANLVRIGLNQDFYMGKSTASTAQIYPKYVQRAARWAEAYGMDVILDLHWVDAQHPSSTSNYMAGPGTQSDTFWASVAGTFKGDNHVMFELYNEPTISDWATWKSNYQAMYTAVRNASANQIVILGGLDWAYDLSGVTTNTANRITGTNIVYNTHPYANKAPSSDWPAKFGTLAASVPVIATEFGSYDCSGSWTQSLITYMEGLGMSWTAWGWYAGGGCSFPSLISSYDGTTLAGGNGDASKTGMAKNP